MCKNPRPGEDALGQVPQKTPEVKPLQVTRQEPHQASSQHHPAPQAMSELPSAASFVLRSFDEIIREKRAKQAAEAARAVEAASALEAAVVAEPAKVADCGQGSLVGVVENDRVTLPTPQQRPPVLQSAAKSDAAARAPGTSARFARYAANESAHMMDDAYSDIDILDYVDDADDGGGGAGNVLGGATGHTEADLERELLDMEAGIAVSDE